MDNQRQRWQYISKILLHTMSIISFLRIFAVLYLCTLLCISYNFINDGLHRGGRSLHSFVHRESLILPAWTQFEGRGIMSEKQQRTAAHMREKMANRYGDGLEHKHDKSHNPYRKHFRSHPAQRNLNEETTNINESTGQQRAYKLKKVRKRLSKGHIH
ncbi:hypothetical protein [Legionella yabuuchiae]|uniref:hypothetical protein n=1 Tax=Legionella yabuuchiae TaxID=376727 RepID=UPI001F5FA380|nr:hypothetical protein [Legionella yabuuchiae]